MLAHAAVRCNVVISETCQSYDNVSEEYLGTTVSGNGCWSDDHAILVGWAWLPRESPPLLYVRLFSQRMLFHFSFKWEHIYTCTHKLLHNLGLKGPLEVQTPSQSRAHLDQVLQLSAPHQVFVWTGTITGKAGRLLLAMHYKEEHKALYVLIGRVS